MHSGALSRFISVAPTLAVQAPQQHLTCRNYEPCVNRLVRWKRKRKCDCFAHALKHIKGKFKLPNC